MKKFIKVISLVLVAVSVLAIAAPAFAYTKTAVSGTRYIYASNGLPVNVRTGPGTSYSKAAVSTFAIGTKVTLSYKATGSDGKIWYECYNSSNQGGWVLSDFLVTSIPSDGGGGSTGNGPQTTTQAFDSGYLDLDPNRYNKYVVNLQLALNYVGSNCGTADGYFGDKTRSAVIDFQGKNGLAVDGVVGTNTKTALWAKAGTYLMTYGIK